MAENHRIRLRLQDFEFEVEGEASFVQERFMEITACERINGFLKGVTSKNETSHVEEDPARHASGISLQEFYSEKEPKTDAEKVVVIAYWLTYVAEDGKSVFKNSHLVNLWTEVLREPKPAHTGTLSRDAKNKKWFIPAAGKMGYWQISRYGRDYVDSELPRKD